MTAELLYFSDPYCIWCFGFGPSIEKISREYQASFRTRVISGGMIPQDMMLREFFGRFPDPVALHERVSTTAGRDFGSAYMDKIKGYKSSNRILNSTTPSRAMAAFRSLGVSDDIALAGAIHDSYYIDGKDLQNTQTYRPIAERFGVEYDKWVKEFGSHSAHQSVFEDYKLTETLGVQGFPGVLLKTAERRYVMIARGFMPYKNLKDSVAAAADHFPVPNETGAAGVACSLDKSHC
ncbi:putative protein-disulfide isomerase [Neorhizobium galegae]|uniref:DsbA family protein n=1 Tax=Neorhizobium galegae TaxID=399 RepID=UPI001AE1FB7B|nr:DsbA family protein [Neorhizobium galegae]MBP2562564.1 putative protein-disulfide isomerase [Neorhizobium galegae]